MLLCLCDQSSTEVQVITASAGGPAEEAGIAPRDELVAIDGQETRGRSLYEAGDLLQGPSGSQVFAGTRFCQRHCVKGSSLQLVG